MAEGGHCINELCLQTWCGLRRVHACLSLRYTKCTFTRSAENRNTVGSNGTESHLPHFPPNLSFIGLFECTECDSKATSEPPSLWIQATCWVCSPPDGTPNSPHFPSYHWEVPILHRAERTSTETKSCVNLWAPLAVTDQGL